MGKSTFFNRMSKSRDALVDNSPGITRDRLYASIIYNGIHFTLVDTGGFDDTGQAPLSKSVKDQVELAIEEADRIIFMVDGQQGIMPADHELVDTLRRTGKKIYLAVNKLDGPEHDNLLSDFYELGLEFNFAVSAAHGYGIKRLMDEVTKDLPGSQPEKYSDSVIRVAILGKPNVGKSSLINKILGSDRLLVSELPGTTRDAVDTPFTFQEKEYLLIDTAGIRRKAKVKEKIEKFSMIKALNSLKRCHVAVILIDASEGVSDQDARICGYCFDQSRGVVLAVNKWDLVKRDSLKKEHLENNIARKLKFISFAPRINVSALTGEKVLQLFEKIDQVYADFSKRIGTPALNNLIQEITQLNPPPRTGGRKLKFYYATQVKSGPPTFVLFLNRPKGIHFSYKRFLTNQLRTHFQLNYTPVRLVFRKRGDQR